MPRKSKTVLVTGAGSGVGQSILKALQHSRYSAVAADCDSLAAGLYAASKAYLIPRANSPAFLPRIIEICDREACSLIFCGVEPELPVLALAAQKLRSLGIITVVSEPEVIELCDDKLSTARFLCEHGFASPDTLPLAGHDSSRLSLPVILKPRKGGARSQGVFLVTTEEDLRYHRATLGLNDYIVQEYVSGEEYTCGTITFDHHCYGVIAMRRVLRNGDTYKAFVVDDPRIREYVKKIAEVLNPFGPCNFQLRIKNGQPCVFDINSRCSGTTACRALAGFNEALMCADYLLEGKRPEFQIKPLSVLRYWKEIVVNDDMMASLQANGKIIGNGTLL
jgi:carbamoyl-phosphate synthase large subunit